MRFTQSLIATFAATQILDVAIAAPPLEARANAVCNSGTYGQLIPLLRNYAPALNFCSGQYPIPCTTKVTKRAVPTTTTSTSTVTSGRTTGIVKSLTTKPPSDPYVSAWSVALAQPAATIRVLCLCIGTTSVSSRYVSRNVQIADLK